MFDGIKKILGEGWSRDFGQQKQYIYTNIKNAAYESRNPPLELGNIGRFVSGR